MDKKQKRRNLVLMQRDINTLYQLYLHRIVSSSQLAKLCFPDISYETSRKRLRRLQQDGLIGGTGSTRLEGRGRPELLYFLTSSGAKALEQFKGISWETISTGPAHMYHKEHFLRLVDIRLAVEEAQRQGHISELHWKTRLQSEHHSNGSNFEEQADATIIFRYGGGTLVKVLLEMDSGNLRQTKHWEPKIRMFLKTGFPIWVVTGSESRIETLRKWTTPLLQESGVGPGKCVFGVYDEIVTKGIFGACWYRTDGSITDLRPKTTVPIN